jgi:hypothetical protein
VSFFPRHPALRFTQRYSDMYAVSCALVWSVACTATVEPTCEPIATTVGGADFAGHGFVDWSASAGEPAIIRGPQGGQHVWLSVRFAAQPRGRLRLRSALRDRVTGAALEKGITTLAAKAQQGLDGTWIVDGLPVFVDKPCEVTDRVCQAWVEVIDADDCAVVASALVTPQWSEDCPSK